MAPRCMVNAHAPSIVFAFFCVFLWMGDIDLKTLRVDGNFFENGDKQIHF